MEVRVLGELQVLMDGAPVDLGGPKPRALLALLVAAEGRPVRVPYLVEQVWGEAPPARVEASLQSYVARLRRELDPHRSTRGPTERLRTHPGAYSLAVDDVDARRFTELLRRARDARPARPEVAETLLGQALALWRGDPYPGLGDCPALAAEATRLDELRLTALEDLWELRVRHGDPAATVAELGRLVRLHPTRERSWATLALAQYRCARQGDALQTLREARAHLAQELGVDPGPELQALEQAVLQQDPTLLPPPRRPAADQGPVRAAPARPAVVGRQADLAACEQVLARAAAGLGRVVVVTGEAGIGKTRFLDALLDGAADASFRTGRGSWEPDGCPALWGWNRAVRALLGRDGVLSSSELGRLDAASESYRMSEVLLQELAGGPPALLVLDDLHWADLDSLRLVRRVAADLADVPVVLAVALRDRHGPDDGPVADLLASLARLDPLRVQLRGLDPQDVVTYVRHDAQVEVDLDVAAALVGRTDGNPFYLSELVRLLAFDDALSRPDADSWRMVPRGVRDVVRQRLSQLPGTARDVLGVAAVVGRSFALPVVETASGLSADQVDDAMEAALTSGLVEPEGPTQYRFGHALTRDAVHEGLPAPTRTRLHGAVAAALEEHHAGRVADHAAELAEHHRLAGPAHARPGWLFARRAAAAAADRSAHAEARRLFVQADELQRLDPLVTGPEREAVQVGLSRALRGLARPVEAWSPLAAAARSALDRGDALAALRMLLDVTDGAVWGWRLRPTVDAAAITLWQRVLQDTPADTPAWVRARAEAALAVEHLYAPGSEELCTGLVDAATARVRDGTGPRERLAVLQVASLATSRCSLLHRRAVLVEEIVALASSTGDHAALAVGLVQRASIRGDTGRLPAAHSDLVRAQQIAEQHHLGQVLVIAGWGLAVVRQAQEDLDGTEAEAVRLSRLEETLALPSAGVGLAQLVGVRMRQGRLAELEPSLRAAAVHVPTALRDLHALSLVHGGQVEQARLGLGPWSEQPPLVEDYLWVTLTVVRAELWLALGDPQAVRDLRLALLPYAGTVATGGMSSLFLGAVDHTLGRLAAADADPVAAAGHLQEAERLHAAMGLPRWADRSRRLREEVGSGGGGAVDGDGPATEGPA